MVGPFLFVLILHTYRLKLHTYYLNCTPINWLTRFETLTLICAHLKPKLT
jgi:hypothetical protein